MRRLFLKLEDAVRVATYHFGTDEDYARQELMQKCYMSNDQYQIGYSDCLKDIQRECARLLEHEILYGERIEE